MVCACALTILLILYILFDVNYFLRCAFTVLSGRLLRKKNNSIFDVTTTYGICSTQDVDLVLKHMNNARYLRELDFARFYFWDSVGLYGEISKRGGGVVQGAMSTRYRRAIPLLTPYKITTKMIYWDEKNLYLEHQFISLTDGFIRAVGLSKQTTFGLKVPLGDVIKELEPEAKLPEVTKELQLWMDSMEQSSQKLKKRD
ncbi:protein THEM6 [Nomia melanderi]|uniref:protein THEM6 n=1 Tax=Nomia melanderi TaxID=2448451 RepID=UPI001304385E|nr:protein THEM6 [Nomia melanderi]